MRAWSFAIVASLASLVQLGCGKEESNKSGDPKADPTNAPGGGPATQQPVVDKKPVDKTPLPKLAPNSGDQSGRALWAVGFGGINMDSPRDIAVAADGSIYVCGYFEGSTQIGDKKLDAPQIDPNDVRAAPYKNKKGNMTRPTADAFLAKVTPDGKIAWGKSWGGERDDDAKSVAITNDTILVVGNFTDEFKLGEQNTRKSNGSDDMFVAAFGKDGAVKWVWTTGGQDSDGANTVAATPDGGWVIGGSFSKDVAFYETKLVSRGRTDAMLIKLDKAGKLEWVKQFGGDRDDTINHVAVDARGNIYVQGEFKLKSNWGGKEDFVAAGASDYDLVLAKYDLNGDHVWSKQFGNPLEDVAGGIAVDPAGSVVITGSFERTISFGKDDSHTSNGKGDVFIARFDTDGKLAWARTYGGSRDDVGGGIAVDGSGNTVVLGWFVNKMEIGENVTLQSKSPNKDIFAMKLDAKGTVVWGQQWGDRDHDQGRALTMDDKGSPYVAGLYRFTLEAVTPALESVRAKDDPIPKADVFVMKLDR